VGWAVPYVDASESLPATVALFASPNPLSEATVISFDLPSASNVSLCVFDVLGRRVATLAEGPLSPGHHTLDWSLSQHAGHDLRDGIYLARLRIGESGTTRTLRLCIVH